MSASKHKNVNKKAEGVFHKTSRTGYRKNTKQGFKGFEWEAHHVLVAACFTGLTHKNLSYIRRCLRVTDWDINKPYNMHGLPVVRSYILAYQSRPGMGRQRGRKEFKQLASWLGKVKAPAGTSRAVPRNLPCHNPSNWGHRDYIEEVGADLKDQIWDTLDKTEKVHESAEQIKPKLDKLAGIYRGKLKSRGARNGGTEINWRNRHVPARANTWFYPFNMSARPVKQDLYY